MGKALAEAFPSARRVFEEVDSALGERLSDIVWNGPADALTLTENAQPALMAVSLAALRALEDEAGVDRQARRKLCCRSFAWRIFGARRGAVAVDCRCGAAVAHPRSRHAESGRRRRRCDGGADRPRIRRRQSDRRGSRQRRHLRRRQRQWRRTGCSVGRQSCGRTRRGTGEASRREARHDAAGLRPLPLPTDAARRRGHGGSACQVSVKPPIVPLVANVLARPINEPAEIVSCLVEQVTGTVRWRESILFMAQAGVTDFYEIGAGKVLTGLIKRIADAATASAIGTPEDLGRFTAVRA